MTEFTVEKRRAIMQSIEDGLSSGELSIGDAIKIIRSDLYGMSQTHYARFMGISDKTLRDIEKGNTDPRLSIVTKLLESGGMRLSAKAVGVRV